MPESKNTRIYNPEGHPEKCFIKLIRFFVIQCVHEFSIGIQYKNRIGTQKVGMLKMYIKKK